MNFFQPALEMGLLIVTSVPFLKGPHVTFEQFELFSLFYDVLCRSRGETRPGSQRLNVGEKKLRNRQKKNTGKRSSLDQGLLDLPFLGTSKLKMSFLFLRWDMLVSVPWRVYSFGFFFNIMTFVGAWNGGKPWIRWGENCFGSTREDFAPEKAWWCFSCFFVIWRLICHNLHNMITCTEDV